MLWLAPPLPFLSAGRGLSTRFSSWPQPSLMFVGFNWELHLTKCPTFPFSGKLLGPPGERAGSSGQSVASAPSTLSSRMLTPGPTLPWASFHRTKPVIWFLHTLVRWLQTTVAASESWAQAAGSWSSGCQCLFRSLGSARLPKPCSSDGLWIICFSSLYLPSSWLILLKGQS